MSTSPYLWNDILRGPQTVKLAHCGVRNRGDFAHTYEQEGHSRGLWIPASKVVEDDDATVTVNKAWAGVLHGNSAEVIGMVKKVPQ